MMKHIVCFFALCAVALASNTTDRVKGGVYASPGEFPYQASITYKTNHICGGAIITMKHIVTAASCVVDFIRNPALAVDLQVLVGTVDLTKDGILYNVEKISLHPEYQYNQKWASYENDIAVIHLKDVMTPSRFVSNIKLPGITELPENAVFIFSGWGAVQPNGPSVRYLQKAGLRYIATSECQRYYPNQKVKAWQFCTSPNRYIGTCGTDAGGPVVLRDALVGISTGQHGCATGVPDVFTKVSYYVKFLIAEVSS